MKKPINRWPLQKSLFWQEMPFFRILIPLIIGIICYDKSWLCFANARPLFIILIVFSGIYLISSSIRKQPQLLRWLGFLALQLFVFFFAFTWCFLQDNVHQNNWFGRKMNSCQAYQVRVSAAPKDQPKTIRLKVDVLAGIQQQQVQLLKGTAFVNVYKNDSLQSFAEGDTLIVPGKWSSIENSGNPFEYDYRTSCRRNNIYAQQFLASDSLIRMGKAGKNAVGFLQKIHTWCDAQLQHYLTNHEAYGLLQAMLLGDEHNFDPELRQAYSDTGIIHIVSISGSHVAVFFEAIMLLFFFLKGRRALVFKFLFSVALVWVYVLMAGAPPSALRAAIMFSIFALAEIVNKEKNSINTLLAAAFVLLCAEPMWLFTVGFQLSFGAVLSILLFYSPIYKLWPQKKKLPKLCWQALSVSFAAEILTAPLVVFYFHNFPVFFFVANIIAAYVIGIVALIGGMLIIAFSWFPFLAELLASFVTRIILSFNWLILKLQGFSPASFKFLYLDIAAVIIVYLIIIFTSIFLFKRRKSALFAGLGFACILMALLSIRKWRNIHQERLVVYNSRQELLLEKTSGLFYEVLNGADSFATNQSAKESHIVWNAWHLSNSKTGRDCFWAHGKKVLLLRNYASTDNDTAVFPVDVLVVASSLKYLSAKDLKVHFNPGILVLGSDQKRWLVDRWKDSCRIYGIPLHATGSQGAFIVE